MHSANAQFMHQLCTIITSIRRVYELDDDAEEEAEPFLGAPLCLPGVIQAEMFDLGGIGLGFGGTVRQ